jgi:predicted dehydrogenase
MSSRRNFIRTSSAALAGAGLFGSTTLESIAGSRPVSQNDKINVALIGTKGMGWADLQSFMKNPEVNVVALCDVDENVMSGRVAELAKNNINVKTHGDYRKLLESKDIDVVIIGTPDHWHCLQMVEACAAGKDVYVEKPIGNSITECNAMVAAQKRYNKAVQVGQWQRSMPHFVDALNFLKQASWDKFER